MLNWRRFAFATVALLLISLVSCFGGGSEKLAGLRAGVDSLRQDVALLRDDLADSSQTGTADAEADFTLQLLHASDMDGDTSALQNVENFSAILSGFRAQFPDNTLVLSSGDNYISGPRYFAAGYAVNDSVLGIAGNGRGDIAFLNAMGFQASAVGNHELDRGTAEFASIIGAETGESGTYRGAMFPYLSSNLLFAADEHLEGLVVPDGQEAMLVGGSLARSAVITVGGHRVGIVGATTPALAAITAEPTPYSLDGLAVIIQDAVDAITGQGVNKVILLAHLQRIDVEQALAARLEDVDIIVAGGSNTLLADETDRLQPGTRPPEPTRCGTNRLRASRCCWSTPMAITGIWEGW